MIAWLRTALSITGVFFSLSVALVADPLPDHTQQPPSPKTLNTLRSFPEIKTKADWQARAKEIREQALVSCGLWPMPERTPLDAHVFGKIERDGYSVEKVYFQTLPGFYLAGNLYRPLGKSQRRFPAILNPHGHWKEGRFADTKDGSIAARCISFARQGMIAFSYDMVGYNDTKQVSHQFARDPTNQLWSVNLMGLQTWNSIRALDFLESLPDVNKKRLACTGESGGGTQTFMLGAVDDRLAAQAPVVMVSHSMQGGCLCENAPGLRIEYSNMEIAAAPAPRPQILVAATGDWTKDTPTVEGPAIEKIYRLFGAPKKLRYVQFDFGHNYNQTSREAVYEWFGQWLLKHRDPASLKELSYQKERDEDLRVWPDGKLPPDPLNEEGLIQSLITRHRAQLDALMPTDKGSLKSFKSKMFPAWRHTLQVEWPKMNTTAKIKTRTSSDFCATIHLELWPEGEEDAKLSAVQFTPLKVTAKPLSQLTTVVLANSDAEPARYEDAGEPIGIAKELVELGYTVLAIEKFSTEKPVNQFTNFFTTYNRTYLQRRVGDLLTVCDQARTLNAGKRSRIVLCGLGRAGLWSLLAAPAADAVIADCDQLNVASDEDLMAADFFCPGIRSIGAFEGAALLAAPHPLLLHNTGRNFSTDAILAAYRASRASEKVESETRRLTEDEIVKWITRLK